MGDLSRSFDRAEFACECGCGFDTADHALVELLQAMRDHFGAAVRISSGCRCGPHNRDIGGAMGSMHLYGRAADLTVDGVTSAEVYVWLNGRLGREGGLKNYGRWVHVDTRTGYWRG